MSFLIMLMRVLKSLHSGGLGSFIIPLRRTDVKNFEWVLTPRSVRSITLTTASLRHGQTEVPSHLATAQNVRETNSQDTLNGLSKDHPVQSLSPAVNYNCSGCGALLQSHSPKCRGFIIKKKLDDWLLLVNDPSKSIVNVKAKPKAGDESSSTLTDKEQEEEGEDDDDERDIEDYFPETSDTEESNPNVSSLICHRCFSLKHYNSALNITLEKDDYLHHLSSLKNKRALIILMLDVTDFPSCVFPNLKSLLSSESSVLIVANKIDLFPRNLQNSFWNKLRDHIVSKCDLGDCKIVGVRFVSVLHGIGTTELSEEIVNKWGNRGDVYLLGSTNVGKSSLFNKLLVHLCGSKPGELNFDTNLFTPKATISQWPGTTLGLLSFPLMSMGKRRRLLQQQRKREEEIALDIQNFESYYEGDEFRKLIERYSDDPRERELASMEHLSTVEVEDVLTELGLRKKKKVIVEDNEPPQNRFWLYDTPGAINDAQLINHLTTKELKIGLPKAPLKPKTFILKPGQCLFLGGLSRLDYVEGSISAYFTVFTWPYLNIHAAKIENADALYERHLGKPNSLFKLPLSFEERGTPFPMLEHQEIILRGLGWKKSAADVILSSTGWVAVTVGGEDGVKLRVHTPKGKGIYIRQPALFDEAVNQRGKRERYGNRTAFLGKAKK